ncbi:aspartate kinase [Daejeonella sp.]|uniref:aspartate kinase n=1 Tax=Daejeonella sp. TaxID=2805397 RepID=UPI002720C125|nr:aspartate kinase [Daejeonella sp.]MDO8991612.1 aspartate kinase [Daejeonella sp.]MDP2413692.1 aspartate kinase [Daejeonella sp.]
MKVFKFGGFAVSSAANIKNLVKIINMNSTDQLLIIVSAMGKTTDALEKICAAYINNSEEAILLLQKIKEYHEQIIAGLFGLKEHPVYDEVVNTFIEIEWMLEDEPHPDYDFNYDQIVSIGELVSSKIIAAYLAECGISTKWIDARSYIHTDNSYREGIIDWDKTSASIQSLKKQFKNQVIISQGFIGGTSENFTTTLGREGSDYSAAVFASCIHAESLTVWKDVPGIMNADPALFSSAQKYEELPYLEALELAYYGANIIHPKTIKPLQNAGIPLFVKPFLKPEESGTRIDQSAKLNTDIQAIILKKNQTLLTISTKDFSYMDEKYLSKLLKAFSEAHIKLNMMQLSALSVSVCLDRDDVKLKKVTDLFQDKLLFSAIEGLELLTMIYFKEEEIKKLIKGKTVLKEQFSKKTAQLVMK